MRRPLADGSNHVAEIKTHRNIDAAVLVAPARPFGLLARYAIELGGFRLKLRDQDEIIDSLRRGLARSRWDG